MFKARWRSEKNRIKAVFRLQFRATQVPGAGWEAMTVTLVPVDVGKPSTRSEKAAVVDGGCNWQNPIYETVKLAQDQKTGKITDKVYQFIISATGSGKSGVLGETNINISDYAEVLKPTSVSLPFQDSNSGAILHVTIQRIQGDIEGREIIETVEMPKETIESTATTLKERRRTLKSQLSNPELEEGGRGANGANDMTSAEEGSFKNSTGLTTLHSSRNTNFSGKPRKRSSSFDDISASGSESSSGQYTPKENGIKNNNAHPDDASFASLLSNTGAPLDTDWSAHSTQDESITGSTNSSGETGLGLRSQQSHNNLEKQKSDVDTLARQLEVSELELQTLRKQIVKESKRGQDLLRELSCMKEERDALRKECEELKTFQKKAADDGSISAKLQFGAKDPWSMLEEVKQELDHEKNLNANLRLQLQKTQESNSELIFAVRDLEELLEQKNRENSHAVKNSQEMGSQHESSNLKTMDIMQESLRMTSDHEEDQHEPDAVVKEHGDIRIAYSQEPKSLDLNSELELYQKDREDLEMQMEQLALDYEILKQENHDISSRLEQIQLREQLRMQYECSAHLSTINDLESQIESLQKELERHAEVYETNLEAIVNEKVVQEQKAINLEEELRKTRWKNANTAEQLQEEFRRLSCQLSTTIFANEELVRKTLNESRELRLEKCRLEELLERSNEQLSSAQSQHQIKCQQLLHLIDHKTDEVNELLLELKDMKEQLDNQKKSAEAMQTAFRSELSVLKTDIEQLSRDKSHLSGEIKQKEKLVVEVENLRTSIKEIEILLQESNTEKDALAQEFLLLKEEANKSLEEMNSLKRLKEEQDATIKNLNCKVEMFITQQADMNSCLADDKFEREDLRKEVFLLSEDFRKEADIIASVKESIKGIDEKSTALAEPTRRTITKSRFSKGTHGSEMIAGLDGNTKPSDANPLQKRSGDSPDSRQETYDEFEQLDIAIVEDNNNVSNNRKDDRNGHLQEEMVQDKESTDRSHDNNRERLGSNVDSSSKTEVETLVSCTCDQQKIAQLISEMSELKGRNESMEAELKEMQERYSEMSLKFAEVEGERQQLVIRFRSLKTALRN